MIAAEAKDSAMLQKIFTDHPRALGESYFEHQRTAFSFSWSLIAAGLAAGVHGVFPCFFETTASKAIRGMNDRILGRSRH